MTTGPRRVIAVAGGFAAAAAVAGAVPGNRLLLLLPGVCAVTAALVEWHFSGGPSAALWRCDAAAIAAAATVAAVLVATLLGLLRGTTATERLRARDGIAARADGSPVALRGEVVAAGVPGRETADVVAVSQLAMRGGRIASHGDVLVEPRSPTDVLPGDQVEVSGSLRRPAQRPGATSLATLERSGIAGVVPSATLVVLSRGGPSVARLTEQLRRGLNGSVSALLPEPQATLVLGIAFGIHGHLDGSVRAPLQNAGLIHVVAVSGLKIVLIAGLVDALAQRLHWPRGRRVGTLMAVLLLYVAISGSGAAAVRSTLMLGAGLLLRRDGRHPQPYALLVLCAALLLAVNPLLVGDIGFQLSFLGTLGILAVADPIARRLPLPPVLAEPFAVTVAAQAATVPVTAGTFGVLSVVGPVANALGLPLLPLVMVPGAAGALLFHLAPGLSWLPLQIAGFAAQALLAVAEGCAALPMAALAVPLWPAGWTVVEVAALAAAAMTWACTRDREWSELRRLTGAAAVAGTVAAAAVQTAAVLEPARLRVTVLDVGTGTAVLLRPPRGGAVLVDGGAAVGPLLTALGRVLSPFDRRLDAVVLTAADRAEAGALAVLAGRYAVGTLVVSGPLPPALQPVAGDVMARGGAVVDVGARAWAVGGMTARCLPAQPEPAAPCLLQAGDGIASVLIVGDATPLAQEEAAAVMGSQLRSQLLVAGTVGFPGEPLLGAVSPDLVALPLAKRPTGLAPPLHARLVGTDGDLAYDDGGGILAPSDGPR